MMWVMVTEPGCNKEQQIPPTAEPPLLPKESVLAHIWLDYANVFPTVLSMN